MAKASRRLAAAVAVIVLAGAARPEGASSDTPRTGRVRSHDAAITELIDQATARSATFRGLVTAIDASDGIVYVDRGKCTKGARSCLLLRVVIAGPFRVLKVNVDTRQADADVVGSIGHELRHVIEVLGDSRVRSDLAIDHLYRAIGKRVWGNFETRNAIEAGMAVRSEMRPR